MDVGRLVAIPINWRVSPLKLKFPSPPDTLDTPDTPEVTGVEEGMEELPGFPPDVVKMMGEELEELEELREFGRDLTAVTTRAFFEFEVFVDGPTTLIVVVGGRPRS